MSNRTVTFQGNQLTLLGNPVEVGVAAPNVQLLNDEMKQVSLADFRGKTLVILSVPSLDTPVCDTEVRTFNEKAASFGTGVAVVAVSMDLPFAQKRWCGAAGIANVTTLSDFRDRAFGGAYGVAIKELGLLARACFVIDAQGTLTYQQVVGEITDEPNYDEVLAAAKKAAGI